MSVFRVILVRILPNSDQNNSEYGHFLRSDRNGDLAQSQMKYKEVDQKHESFNLIFLLTLAKIKGHKVLKCIYELHMIKIILMVNFSQFKVVEDKIKIAR